MFVERARVQISRIKPGGYRLEISELTRFLLFPNRSALRGGLPLMRDSLPAPSRSHPEDRVERALASKTRAHVVASLLVLRRSGLGVCRYPLSKRVSPSNIDAFVVSTTSGKIAETNLIGRFASSEESDAKEIPPIPSVHSIPIWNARRDIFDPVRSNTLFDRATSSE